MKIEYEYRYDSMTAMDKKNSELAFYKSSESSIHIYTWKYSFTTHLIRSKKDHNQTF